MKRYVLMIIAAVLHSCGLWQTDVGVHSGSDGIWHGPSYGKHMSGTVYAVGLDYPDGYDWRTDMEKGDVRCSMVLLADGTPVLKVPVGQVHEISSDNDRHRLRSGRLYTDFTDGMTTVIKKDGVEIIRYDGSEDILCLEEYGGQVHSLSRPAGGSGFRYRVDGNLVIERSDATPFLHLKEHADSVRFFFCQEQNLTQGKEMRYYQVADGIVRRIPVDSRVTKVWDMDMIDGKVSVAVSFPDMSLALFQDGNQETIKYMTDLDMISCTFCGHGRMCLWMRYLYSGDDLMTDVLWLGSSERIIYRMARDLSAVYVDDDGYNTVINPTKRTAGLIFTGERANAMPDGYRVCSKDCILQRDGSIYVALSSDKGGPPLIWKDGTLDTLNMDGPLTCLQ